MGARFASCTWCWFVPTDPPGGYVFMGGGAWYDLIGGGGGGMRCSFNPPGISTMFALKLPVVMFRDIGDK